MVRTHAIQAVARCSLIAAGCTDSAGDDPPTPVVSELCGNGVVDDGEACDDGTANSDVTADACRTDGLPARCGDGDLAGLPDTIAGYAQALIRLRDTYAPDNVYMGLCEFDNRNGNDPEHSVQFIESLNSQWDLLFTHHVVKYSTKDDGWWDAYSETDHARFLTWLDTITTATGLRYFHWQAVIGAMDYGLMPDYPTQERISPLVAAGSAACLMDLYTLDGPPHSQPWHGFTASPPDGHPAENTLDRLAERLQRYYQAPIPLSAD